MDDEDGKEKLQKDRDDTTRIQISSNIAENNENTEQSASRFKKNISEPLRTTTSNSLIAKRSLQNVENDWKKTQFLLAEAESAPKHLLCYTAQEKLAKFLETCSDQNSNVTKQNYADGPSCSRLVTATNIAIEQSNPTEELTEKSENTQTKLSETDSIKIPTTKSVFKKESDIEAELTYGTFKPIDIETSIETNNADPTPVSSVRSIGSLVCRICHNSENPERLVSPCLCKGSLSFVHIHCLERWISTSRSTVCELCQFQYNTEQTLRYTCIQSLRMWYSRSMSRRALQEDCQMFSLLTLVAFGIIGTLLVGIQYYFVQGRHWGLSSMWTKGWLLFFLFTTVIVACSLILLVYFINIYMILRSQLAPWYRWWQSARDIKLILENRKPFKILPGRRIQRTSRQSAPVVEQQPTSDIFESPQALPPPMPAAHPTPPAIPPPPPPPPRPQPSTVPPTSLMLAVNKLQIPSELTRTAAEIIEIPYEVFDSCTFESIAINI